MLDNLIYFSDMDTGEDTAVSFIHHKTKGKIRKLLFKKIMKKVKPAISIELVSLQHYDLDDILQYIN